MAAAAHPQVRAADPRASAWVSANAGSGKTSTLVSRVARLLLAGTAPEHILCVTYTKAAAAEMQRRVFDTLGDWAVMADSALKTALADIDESGADIAKARRLFARALETPGGLKIETIHAFCEKLLRRFPLEAGVSPGFRVVDDIEAAEISAGAREQLALAAIERPAHRVAAAYAHFSLELAFDAFEDLFAALAARRRAIAAFVARDGMARVWRDCGLTAPVSAAAAGREAVARIRWNRWRWAADCLAAGGLASDLARAAAMRAIGPESPFEDLAAIFLTGAGEPRKILGGKACDAKAKAWLLAEQARFVEALGRVRAARIAEETCHVLVLALAYSELYQGAKDERGGLDFDDLIETSRRLLTEKADAAWVLYKLDGGIDHLLLDEGQDTSPEQWDIVRALAGEFFVDTGAGAADRTVFAVADEKQSIFSFQGAAPERFAAERAHFQGVIHKGGKAFHTIPLLQSYRSAPEILAFVDAVFAEPEAAEGLRPTGANISAMPIVHEPVRPPGGSVELWPLEIGDTAEAVDVWAPVDAEPSEGKNKRLARRIARSIAAMVARSEAVVGPDGRERPCAWSDFLILVRRRGALFHEIIRALKAQGAPVGGADRLKLSEHGVFTELMALAWFIQFPSDDLSLAAILRGPFCDLSESDLFELAHDRGAILWVSLLRRVGERPGWRAAADFLSWARETARERTPFDFYGAALAKLDGEGRSMRTRLITRMGAEGEDALDAFMAETLAAEGRGARDLETFAAAMSASSIDVKREQSVALTRPGGEVRVMTVHGAKGLEAPIVILPDTSTRARPQGAALLEAADGGFLWAPREKEDCPASTRARLDRKTALEHESSRLLYVALTRARDRLIICGVEAQAHLFERSWYDFAARAFSPQAVAFPLEGGGEGRRLGSAPAVASAKPGATTGGPGLPPWAFRRAPREAALERPLAPSGLGEGGREPAVSPLAASGGLGRYRRGDIIHRLLQILPDLAIDARAGAAAALLAREAGLSEDQRSEMAAAALAVLDDERFAAVFGPGSKAEVAIAGGAKRLGPTRRISGRLDRLVVEADRVLVVDFKTNRPAPDRIEDADPGYVRQMAVYCAVLAEVFPSRRIEAALVWTDGPKLMPVPENLIAKALDEIAAIG